MKRGNFNLLTEKYMSILESTGPNFPMYSNGEPSKELKSYERLANISLGEKLPGFSIASRSTPSLPIWPENAKITATLIRKLVSLYWNFHNFLPIPDTEKNRFTLKNILHAIDPGNIRDCERELKRGSQSSGMQIDI